MRPESKNWPVPHATLAFWGSLTRYAISLELWQRRAITYGDSFLRLDFNGALVRPKDWEVIVRKLDDTVC